MASGTGTGTGTITRTPTWRERENNKIRERRRRAIAAKIFAGLRTHGNYSLPKHCDNNEVLMALCREAGWSVEPDGTTYRKRCKTVEHRDLVGGGSASPSPCSSSYHQSPCASFNPSPTSSSFPSPSSSSHATTNTNLNGVSLIPWLKNLSSGSFLSSSSPHLCIHGGSISAPVTPPFSSPTSQNPRVNIGHYAVLPSSSTPTPPSPGDQSIPVSQWFSGIQLLKIKGPSPSPSQPTSPTFSLVSTNPFGLRDNGPTSRRESHIVTPGERGTCSPAGNWNDSVGDAPLLSHVILRDEFAFGSSRTEGMVKAWEGEEIVHEDIGSDDLELTLGSSRTQRQM